MSHEALRAVDESRAFEATRRFEELSLYHVPFDELNGDKQTEDAFTHMVANQGRVAIIGPSGSGKSSLIAAVLGPLALDLPDHIVPLRGSGCDGERRNGDAAGADGAALRPLHHALGEQ